MFAFLDPEFSVSGTVTFNSISASSLALLKFKFPNTYVALLATGPGTLVKLITLEGIVKLNGVALKGPFAYPSNARTVHIYTVSTLSWGVVKLVSFVAFSKNWLGAVREVRLMSKCMTVSFSGSEKFQVRLTSLLNRVLFPELGLMR